MVLVVRPTSGGYVLGFRADPQERLKPLYNELTALHQAYNERPIFGLELNWDKEVRAMQGDSAVYSLINHKASNPGR